jgi:hypothetical protein
MEPWAGRTAAARAECEFVMIYRRKRSSAGRKGGTVAKKTREAPETLTQVSSIAMLDIMVTSARYFYRQAVDAEIVIETLGASRHAELKPEARFKVMLAEATKAAGLRELACQVAQDAARFLHAPMRAVQIGATGKAEDVPPVVERMRFYRRREAIVASAAAGREVGSSGSPSDAAGLPPGQQPAPSRV